MNSFIRTLVREEKLKLTEPSDDIASSYLMKSEKSLLSAKTLLTIENYDDATALTYYSMYYSALAILYRCGIKSENHSGTIIMLDELFNIPNDSIRQAKKERVDKQYYVEFKATIEDVQEGIRIAEQFNTIIKERMDKMSHSEAQEYRARLKETYF